MQKKDSAAHSLGFYKH